MSAFSRAHTTPPLEFTVLQSREKGKWPKGT